MKLRFVVLGGAGAGKSSILRRYFHGTFDASESRFPTVGADFYSGRIDYPFPVQDDDGQQTDKLFGDEKKDGSPIHSVTSTSTVANITKPISIQIWDTPGRERYSNLDNKNKARYTATFSDNFLRNVDAAVLIYDVSSSTSFTHVLKWHSELMERLRRMEANGERRRPLPILIVGNKIDIVQERATQKELRKKEVVRQRDVLGLTGKFRGNDYRYEYRAEPRPSTVISPTSATLVTSCTSTAAATLGNHQTILKNGDDAASSHRNRFEISTYMGTKTNYLESILNNEVYRGSYLDSLLSSEDKSHPDKDMVLLWCMRNGLMHMDVSAKTGAGVDDLINQLIKIALEQQLLLHGQVVTNTGSTNDVLQRNKKLDIRQRYAPRSQSCFQLPFQRCCKP